MGPAPLETPDAEAWLNSMEEEEDRIIRDASWLQTTDLKLLMVPPPIVNITFASGDWTFW